MAATSQGATLTAAHRRSQLAIRARALQELMALWPMLDLADLERTFPPFSAAAEALIRARHDQSAGTAAAYYRAFRSAEDPKVRALRADILRVSAIPKAQTQASLTVSTIAAYRKAISAGKTVEQAQAAALAATSGAMTRLVLSGSRKMLDTAIQRDPAAVGYARVTDGNPCHFCAMLAGRGAVYTEATATRTKSGSRYHDRCGCQPEPIIRGTDYTLPGDGEKFAALWQDSGGDVNAFRRAYERPDLHQH